MKILITSGGTKIPIMVSRKPLGRGSKAEKNYT